MPPFLLPLPTSTKPLGCWRLSCALLPGPWRASQALLIPKLLSQSQERMKTRDRLIENEQRFPTPSLGFGVQDPEACLEGSREGAMSSSIGTSLALNPLISRSLGGCPAISSSLQTCPLDVMPKTPINISLIFLLLHLPHRRKNNNWEEEKRSYKFRPGLRRTEFPLFLWTVFAFCDDGEACVVHNGHPSPSIFIFSNSEPRHVWRGGWVVRWTVHQWVDESVGREFCKERDRGRENQL